MKRLKSLFTRRWRSKVSSLLLATVLWLVLRQIVPPRREGKPPVPSSVERR